MKSNSKIAIIAGLGALAGGVIGYYISTKRRQTAGEVIEEQTNRAANFADDLAIKAKNIVSNISAKAQSLMATASSTAEHTAEQVKENVAEGVHKIISKVEKAASNGHSG